MSEFSAARFTLARRREPAPHRPASAARKRPQRLGSGVRGADAEREQVQPLTADLRRAHITVTKRWVEKLEAARCALSHSIPSGSAAEVIEVAFDALLEREAKRKLQVRGAKLR